MRVSDRIAVAATGIGLVAGVVVWLLRPPTLGQLTKSVDTTLVEWHDAVIDEFLACDPLCLKFPEAKAESYEYYGGGQIERLGEAVSRDGLRRVTRWTLPHEPIIDPYFGMVEDAELWLIAEWEGGEFAVHLLWYRAFPEYGIERFAAIRRRIEGLGIDVVIDDMRPSGLRDELGLLPDDTRCPY